MEETKTSSPKTDSNALRLASAIFMIVAWLMMVALLVYWFVLWPTPALFLYVWFDVLFLLFLVPLVLIPIQIVRYFRRKHP
jgi:membrane protein YdbS with pleckstrin-like domain